MVFRRDGRVDEEDSIISEKATILQISPKLIF